MSFCTSSDALEMERFIGGRAPIGRFVPVVALETLGYGSFVLGMPAIVYARCGPPVPRGGGGAGEIGASSEAGMIILSGLEPGDSVVTNGAFLLRSELAGGEIGEHGH